MSKGHRRLRGAGTRSASQERLHNEDVGLNVPFDLFGINFARLSMTTGLQYRLARLALRMSVAELAERAELGTSTIKRIEAVDGVPSSTASNTAALKRALEAAGIEFIEADDGSPGIIIRNTRGD